MSAWFKPDSPFVDGTRRAIVYNNPAGGSPGVTNRPALVWDKVDQKLAHMVDISGAYGNVDAVTTTYEADTWYHIAGSYDGTKTKIYIDGVLETEKTTFSGAATSLNGIHIGADHANHSNFAGAIDQVGIWDQALSDGGVAVGGMAGGDIAKLVVPEPSTVMLLSLGLLAVAGSYRRRLTR